MKWLKLKDKQKLTAWACVTVEVYNVQVLLYKNSLGTYINSNNITAKYNVKEKLTGSLL